MEITERFINYTKFDTQSDDSSESVPSTPKQLVFAEYLKKEMEREGLSDVEMDEMGYLYGTLKANCKKKIPTIGFISHYDTSPDSSGKDVKAREELRWWRHRIVARYRVVANKIPRTKKSCGRRPHCYRWYNASRSRR